MCGVRSQGGNCALLTDIFHILYPPHQVARKKEEERALLAEWAKEKAELEGTKQAQKELETARREAELAQRRGDFAKAGELVHAVIPGLERRANAGKAVAGGGAGGWVCVCVWTDGSMDRLADGWMS